MKKFRTVSHEDWEKIVAGMEASCNAALDLYTMLAVSLGRCHPATKKALTVHTKSERLKSDMCRMAQAQDNARGMFGAKAIGSHFPSVTENKKDVPTIPEWYKKYRHIHNRNAKKNGGNNHEYHNK